MGMEHNLDGNWNDPLFPWELISINDYSVIWQNPAFCTRLE